MKKKLLSLILVGVMTMTMLTACDGSKETPVEEVATDETSEAEAVEETTEEATPDPTPEEEKETTLGYVTTEEETEAEKSTEEVSEVEEFNKDIAMTKVTDLFNARNELFKNGKVDTDLNFLVAAETLTGGIKLTGIKTSDGFNTDEDGYPKFATIINYFYDYVNNGCGYYDLGEYLTSHTADEILNKYAKQVYEKDTDNVIMLEAPGVLPYLLENLDNLSFGDLISGEECTAAPVSDVDVYYEMPILINGEKCGVTAVFDEAGNLLNLITVDEDGWTDDNYRDSTNEVLALE